MGTNASDATWQDLWNKSGCWTLKWNIARGTTNPRYWVYNFNFFLDRIEFVSNLAADITQASDSIPWVRCASGNVSSMFDVNILYHWPTVAEPLQVNKCTFFQYILCAMFDVDILYGWMTLSLSKLPNGPGSLFITFHKSTWLTSSYVKLGDKSQHWKL